jgi:hypothetical protein
MKNIVRLVAAIVIAFAGTWTPVVQAEPTLCQLEAWQTCRGDGYIREGYASRAECLGAITAICQAGNPEPPPPLDPNGCPPDGGWDDPWSIC